METFKLPAGLRLVAKPQGLLTRTTKPKLFILALALSFAGTAVSTTAHAKGLLEILFGNHSQNVTQVTNFEAKVNLNHRHRARLRHQFAAIKQELLQSCSTLQQTNKRSISRNRSNQCDSFDGGSGGFAFIAAGGGGTVVNFGGGGGTVVVPSYAHGSFVALSGTVGFIGTVTVPGGQSVTVGGFQTVKGGVSVAATTAPLRSSGFGTGSALGSASSLGAGSAASNSAGYGNSLTQTVMSSVGATSSGGSGKSIGAGVGLGAGVGISAGIK